MATKEDIIKYVQHTPENTNPSVLGSLLSDLQKGKSIQPDWNQNDETAADYVKNRPFYTGDPVETVFVEESTISFAAEDGLYMAEFESMFEPTVGETYKVYWDGTTYESICVNFSDSTIIGNLSIAGAGSDTGEPFVMSIENGLRIVIGTADTSASHTLSISGFAQEVVKIDKKYLPDTIATKSEVEVAQTTAETAQTTAETAQTTANAALERAVEPYTRNTQMAPLYKNGGFSAWRNVVQEIWYDKTEGYFFVNAFDTTALREEDMPDGVFCVSVYVENRSAKAFLSKSITTGGLWLVSGFAVITDKYYRTGEVLYVSTNTISKNEAKGLF